MELTLIFPNQLFENSDLIKSTKHIVLIEEYLFFRHYNFHKQKILFHRMSMKFYQDYLSTNHKVEYVESQQPQSDVRNFIKEAGDNVERINIYDPNDNWLLKRISWACKSKDIELVIYENPLFLLKKQELNLF